MFIEENIPFTGTDIDVDITDKSAVRNFLNGRPVRWIVICSAYTAVDAAEDNSGAAFAVNADGVSHIAELCRDTGIKIINFSTDYVFPGKKSGGYCEDDLTGPESVYGRSKLAGEKILLSSYREYFIFRISWLYGPYGKNFVHTMLDLFKEREELNVVNDQFGSPTYTGELASFVLRLIKTDSESYGLYHFSGDGMTDWFQFAFEIYRLALKYKLTEKELLINPVDSSKYPSKAKRPTYSYMLKDKLQKTFNYKPAHWKTTLEEYIKLISR